MKESYTWVPVFNKIAKKLLEYKNNRQKLVNIMYEILEELNLFDINDKKNCNLDKFNGVRCKYDDIDPFSFMNRLGIYKDEKRKEFIKKFQEKNGMEIEVPTDFEGVPSVNAFLSCMISYKDDRKENEINDIWELFEVALKYPNTKNEEYKNKFIEYYDKILNKPNCKFNISMCLFRMDPYFYVNLDSTNREYMKKKLNLDIKKCPTGKEYLNLIEKIKKLIQESKEFDSIIHFSKLAWQEKKKHPKYWLYSPGEKAIYWETCMKENIMVIGFDEIGNLETYNTEEEIFNTIKLYYEKDNPYNDKCACIDFYKTMQIGDIIIAKTGTNTLLGYGIVESDYYYDINREKYRNVRKVNWIKTGKWKNTIVNNALKTLTEISQYPGYPEKILNIINGDELDMDTKYYWLNANPKIWSFSNIKVGETIEYTSINDKGNKRKIYQHYLNAKKGDKIIAYESTPVKAIVGLCEIEEELNNNILKVKKIEHLINPVPLKEINELEELQNMEYLKNGQGSLFKLEQEEYNLLYDIIRESNPITKNKYETYDEKKFLKDVYIDKKTYEDLTNLLKRKKNIILQGAPGVGKTYMAKKLAYLHMKEKNDNRIEFIQFHQNYSYEDFIEGYRPTEDGKFELAKGIFYNFCKKAENDPTKPYYMIIDEINRGNLSKIFGELLMLIEEDKRNESLTLAYSKTKFSIPSNIYIIGMMNTADRSIAILDYALRRRFSFVDIEPVFNNKEFEKYQKKLNNNYLNRVIEQIKLLNKEIENDETLGKSFEIGHSYFCNLEHNCSNSEIKSIIKYDIIPMLKEYWYDEKEKVNEWSEKLLKG